jgi:Flp pilus assembly protein TadD
MRALLAMAALAVLLLPAVPGAARAGDDSAPAVNAELLKQMRDAQAEREQAMVGTLEEKEPATVEEILAKGDAERAKGDHPRALWNYLMAHRLDRADPRPIGRIGTLHLSREPERSEAIFRELVHREGDSAIARTGLGLALIARGEWGEAVVELRKAVDDDEALAATHNALGVALDHLKQTEAARWHYRRAAQLQPRSHEPFNNLGVSLLTTGDFAGAAAAFEEATRIEKRDPAVWNNLGIALGRLKRYDAALDAFRKAGDELSAWNNVGYTRYLNGDYDGAMLAYERALLAAGKPEDRLPVLRNARAAQRAKENPPAAAKPRAETPPAGSDAPGLGANGSLSVEEVAPPAAVAPPASIADGPLGPPPVLDGIILEATALEEAQAATAAAEAAEAALEPEAAEVAEANPAEEGDVAPDPEPEDAAVAPDPEPEDATEGEAADTDPADAESGTEAAAAEEATPAE